MTGDTETPFDPARSVLRFASTNPQGDASIHVLRTGAPTSARQAKYDSDDLAQRVDTLLNSGYGLCGARINGIHVGKGMSLTRMSETERLCERCHALMGDHADRIFDGLIDDDVPAPTVTLARGRITPSADPDKLSRLDVEVLSSTGRLLAECATATGVSYTEAVRRSVGFRLGVEQFLNEGWDLVYSTPTAAAGVPTGARQVVIPNTTPEATDEDVALVSVNINAETAEAFTTFNIADGNPPFGETLRRGLALYRSAIRNEQLSGHIALTHPTLGAKRLTVLQ